MSMRFSLRLRVSLLCGLAAFVTLASQVSAITVVNQSFELPAAEKVWFHDTAGAVNSDVPGWTASGPGLETCCSGKIGDSGVETAGGGSPNSGIYNAFLVTADPSIFQTTSHILAADDQFILRVAALNLYTSETYFGGHLPDAAYLRSTLYYLELDGTARTPLVTADYNVINGDPVPWGNYELALTSLPAAAIGRPLGVELANVTREVNAALPVPVVIGPSWLRLDNVRIDLAGGPGDVNADGLVDLVDYGIIRDHLGQVASRELGDLTGDGVVNLNDFRDWELVFHAPPLEALTGTSVPEPATCVMLLLAASSLTWGRRR
jgi:hypothetical protein